MGGGGSGRLHPTPAPACSLCPSPVGRTTARGTPKSERVTQAACPVQPKGDRGSSTASSQTLPGHHSAFKAPVVSHSILLAYRVGLLTALPCDFMGSLRCRRKPRSSPALNGVVTLHPTSPSQAGSLFLLQLPAVSLEASRGRSSLCPTLHPALLCPSALPPRSTLVAPSSRKPVCALSRVGVSLWRPQEVLGFLATAQSSVHHG